MYAYFMELLFDYVCTSICEGEAEKESTWLAV